MASSNSILIPKLRFIIAGLNILFAALITLQPLSGSSAYNLRQNYAVISYFLGKTCCELSTMGDNIPDNETSTFSKTKGTKLYSIPVGQENDQEIFSNIGE